MMYQTLKNIQSLYQYLLDELSKKIFLARLSVDIEPSMTNIVQLLKLNPLFSPKDLEEIRNWKKLIQAVNHDERKFILYGTGGRGKVIGKALLYNGIEFYGFCGRRGPAAFPDGLLGKPVISPEYLCRHADEFYVVIAAEPAAVSEIMNLLADNHFPPDHILHLFQWSAEEKMYFEFPDLYRHGTAFVDAGCLNCCDDYRFVEWCGGEYSQIIAFEPDPPQYAECMRQLEQHTIRDIRIIQAGLSSRTGKAEFATKVAGASCIIQKNPENSTTELGRVKARTTIRTTTLDAEAGAEAIGFIKMDIEGAELDALHGAEHTIIRDKPFLAISVYHKPGDMLAIMDYLHKVVPEYRFMLRHYGPLYYETVLYASVV